MSITKTSISMTLLAIFQGENCTNLRFFRDLSLLLLFVGSMRLNASIKASGLSNLTLLDFMTHLHPKLIN
jgi:hypothetical protein